MTALEGLFALIQPALLMSPFLKPTDYVVYSRFFFRIFPHDDGITKCSQRDNLSKKEGLPFYLALNFTAFSTSLIMATTALNQTAQKKTRLSQNIKNLINKSHSFSSGQFNRHTGERIKRKLQRPCDNKTHNLS